MIKGINKTTLKTDIVDPNNICLTAFYFRKGNRVYKKKAGIHSFNTSDKVREFKELMELKFGGYIESVYNLIIWEGKDLEKVGRRSHKVPIIIEIDPGFFKAKIVNKLLGDSSKAGEKLNFEPKLKKEDLISEIINEDLKENPKESIPINNGFSFSNLKNEKCQQIIK